MSCSGSTVRLKGQMNRGGYLKICENGGLEIEAELPTDRNQGKNKNKTDT